MKDLIRKWLGLDIIDCHLMDIRNNSLSNRLVLNKIEQNTRTYAHAQARIIAKLNPMYGVSDQDPARKDASDKLGEEVLKRLKGEVDAMEKHNQ